MNKISICIFIVLLIIIFAYLVSYIMDKTTIDMNKNEMTIDMNGGEYYGLYDENGKVEILSPSQRNALISTDGDLKYKIDKAKETFEKDITLYVADKPEILTNATPKRLSDAHIDLEIINDIFKPDNGFGVCEANTSILKDESLNYKNNIPSYITESEIVVDRERKYSFELRKINTHVFIEFSYSTIHNRFILMAYKNIHEFMIDIFTHLKTINTDHKLIIVYYFHVESNENLKREINDIIKIENKDVRIQVFANVIPSKQKIIVPDSETFAMDEFITFNDVFIQIEHSESGKSHKSNIVEFLLRSMHYFSNSSSYSDKIESNIEEYFKLRECIRKIKIDSNYIGLRNKIANYSPRTRIDGRIYKQDEKNYNRWLTELRKCDEEINDKY